MSKRNYTCYCTRCDWVGGALWLRNGCCPSCAAPVSRRAQ